MKKKVFYQNSIAFVVFFLILGFMPFIAIYLLIVYKLSFYEYVLYVLVIIVYGCEIYKFIRFRIVLSEEDVYVNSDWLSKREKIQYETRIPYKDIEKIDVIKSEKNSLGKKIQGRAKAITKKTYLRFLLKTGNFKYIHVTFFSKKSIFKIIDAIQKRIEYKKTISNK